MIRLSIASVGATRPPCGCGSPGPFCQGIDRMHGITAPSRLANAVRLFARARVSAASSGQWRARDWRRHGHRSQPGIDGAS